MVVILEQVQFKFSKVNYCCLLFILATTVRAGFYIFSPYLLSVSVLAPLQVSPPVMWPMGLDVLW